MEKQQSAVWLYCRSGNPQPQKPDWLDNGPNRPNSDNAGFVEAMVQERVRRFTAESELRHANEAIEKLREQLAERADELALVKAGASILAEENKRLKTAHQDGIALTHPSGKGSQISQAIGNYNRASTNMGLPLHDRY